MSSALQAKQILAERELAKRDLVYYMDYMYRYHRIKQFHINWHHHLIAAALKGVLEKKITRLMINIAPSYGKTETVCRSFVSWALGQYPQLKFIYSSYGSDLTEKVSVETRDYISSKPYQAIFNTKLKKDSNLKTDWAVEGGGGFFGTTVGGAVTGRHGNILLVDDPTKAIEAYSQASKQEAIRYFQESLLSRLEEFDDTVSAIVIIMQRLAPDDLCGFLLENQPNLWVNLNLVALNDEPITYELNGYKYERAANEPLFPAKHDLEALLAKKLEMGETAFSSQFQGDPIVSNAGFFLKDCFKFVSELEVPTWQNLYIFVDMAQSVKKKADKSAIVVIGYSINDSNYEVITIMDVFAHHYEFGDLKKELVETCIKYPDAQVFIEGAGGGIVLEQEIYKDIAIANTELRARAKPLIKNSIECYTPDNQESKVAKITALKPYALAGQIQIRRNANQADDLLAEFCAFSPEKTANKDDIIDCVASSLKFAVAGKRSIAKASNKSSDYRKYSQQKSTWRL